MEEKSLRILEFDKIRQRLADKAVINTTREKLLKLMPSVNAEKIVTALRETDEARGITVKYGAPPISPISDVRPLVKRSLIGASLSCGDLLNVAHLLRITRGCLKYIDIRDFEIDYPVLNTICAEMTALRDTEQNIFNAIISEEELDDNASPALSAIRRKKLSLSNRVRDILNDIIHSPNYAQALQDAIITMRGGRFVVPVKAEHKSTISGVVHDTSQSGATLFVEPHKVVEINNEIRKLTADEKAEIERILAELSGEVAEHSKEITHNYNALIRLDIIFSKARLADEMDASCPVINEEGIIEIKKGRHPLIDAKKVVPIDIRLGEDFDTLVITGPNTGGKTVSLKTLGLFTLMAQAGLHIPAKDGSRIAVFENVFADIGDEQSIEQSLSTFSSHMVNIVNIISKADYKSLVLFDELGAGTDPTEGAALATAILKEVRSRGARIAATTHYSEIKLFALSTEGVENAACEFNVETLCPTYRLLIGALGKSNAFAIAKRLGMNDDIIESAKQLINTESIKFEDVVNKIEAMGQKADRDREEAERDRAEAERIRRELEEKSGNMAQKKEKILENARREARQILEDARAEIDLKIKETEKLTAHEKLKALEEVKRSIKRKSSKIDEDLYKGTVKASGQKLRPEDIKPGTTLLINAMGQKGTAIKAPDKDGNVEIQVGLLKVKTHISTVSYVDDEETKKKAKQQRRTSSRTLNISNEIDVRGYTLDEALLLVDRYIDDVVLSNLTTVTIIHGKGNGILRKGIQDYLKTHRNVKSYRSGVYGEGENGVTIVEMA